MFAQCGLKSVQLLVAEPVKERAVAETIATLGQQDQNTAAANCLGSVLHRLMGLDQVDALGETSTGGDYQISFFFSGNAKRSE